MKRSKYTMPASPLLGVKIGQRIGAVDGPGRSPKDDQGMVTQIVTNRWGAHAVVLMDNGRKDSIHSFTDVGIGWYLL